MLKLTEENYCAEIITLTQPFPVSGFDNLQGVSVLGFTALVPKYYKSGDIVVLFTAETQLSHEYCSQNNLYRDSTLNKDQTQKGYLELNRRVRAIKMKSVVSSALVMPITSLSFLGEVNLKPGDRFNFIGDHHLAQKYVIKTSEPTKTNKPKQAKKSVVEAKLFPEHFSTPQFFRSIDTLPEKADFILTAKLHGSSGRFTNTKISRKLSLIEKIAKWFGIKVNEYEYCEISGSRKVIHAPNKEYNGFYQHDIWTETLNKLRMRIPKNWILLGEIIGWSGDKPIQKNYSYGLPKGTNEFYVYRICVVNDDGVTVDLCWDQIKEFCKYHGIKHVPELARYNNLLDIESFYKKVENKKFVDLNLDSVPCPESPCDEGFCVRIDGLTPTILKAKFPIFLGHESSLLDTGVDDGENS